MIFRRTIPVLFAGCAVFSPGANAFWFFQHRPAPVTRLSHSHHHPGHRRHHRHDHPHSRHVRTYRRVITEYRIYYVPRPYPAPQRAKGPAPGLKRGLPPPVTTPGTPGTLPAPAAADAAPAPRPPAADKLPATHAAQAPGSTLAPTALPAGVAATSAYTHRAAPISAYQAAPAGTALPGTATTRPVHAAARPQQVADSSPLTQTVPGAIAPRPYRSAGIQRIAQESPSLAFLAPLVAALAALSGLGYAVFRKRKRTSPETARQAGAMPAQPDPPASPATAGATRPHPAATPRRGFNFDEVRRVNVNRIFMSPLAQGATGTGQAAAVATTNAGGNTETAGHAPLSSEAPVTVGEVVHHVKGDLTQGVVDELYDTPEARGRQGDFYAHIPAEFQALTWMKVTYNQGRNYTFATAEPGLVIHPGDTVRLEFGQQDPPVPNQVVAVVHMQSPSPGTDAGLVGGPA